VAGGHEAALAFVREMLAVGAAQAPQMPATRERTTV
jgi:hypothetical protein